MTRAPVNPETLDFLVAGAIVRLVLLGCGRYKSVLEAIEEAVDERLIDTNGLDLDPNELGYIKDEKIRKCLSDLIVEKISDSNEFARISSKFELPLPEKMFPIEEYLAEE